MIVQPDLRNQYDLARNGVETPFRPLVGLLHPVVESLLRAIGCGEFGARTTIVVELGIGGFGGTASCCPATPYLVFTSSEAKVLESVG